MRQSSSSTSKRLGAALFSALLGCAAIGAAYAQGTPATPAAPGTRAEQRMARMQDRREAMHARLHDTLKLSAAQEPAWQKFNESMKPPARPQRESLSGLTAPERADKMLEFSRQHLAEAEKRAGALKEFYGQLSAEQKRAFDGFHAGMMMPAGDRHHHHMYRGGPGAPGAAGTTRSTL